MRWRCLEELFGVTVREPVNCTRFSNSCTLAAITASFGRSFFGFMRRPKATLSNTVMWRNSA